MNVNPIDGSKIVAECIIMNARERGINANDMGEKEGTDFLSPRIERSIGTYTVDLQKKCRKLEDGRIIPGAISQDKRKMQIAITKEQLSKKLDSEFEIE